MFQLTPSLDSGDASANLSKLISAEINADLFRSSIQCLQNRFDIYSSTCPAPFIAPGLIVTPEIRRQSELYLPMAEITRIFNRLYLSALSYSPILSSTNFHKTLSWADAFAGFPSRLQFSVNPSLLLKKLLADRDLLLEFIFESFLPGRFYGGFGRYPEQEGFIRKWLVQRQKVPLRCLDAACGTAEDSYGLANLLIELGIDAEEVRIEGWTIEPLEVWAAAHCSFPHDRQREIEFLKKTSRIFEKRYHSSICLACVDLKNPPSAEPFDLILCNGLLGGPIVNETVDMERVVSNLERLVAPGGVLLAADSFHGGWKQQCPQQELRALLEMNGLETFQAGEGVGGLKPD